LREEEVILVIFSLIICGGVLLMIAAMWTRRRMREMTHRERLAMIDRGLIPTPDDDPIRLDPIGRSSRVGGERGERFRTAGVLMIGLGLGLTVLITFTAGQLDIGLGIGGAWAVLGCASLLNYFLISRGGPEEPFPRWTPPPRSPEPPRTPEPPPGPDSPSSR
jgi:hypothetical protein